MSNFAPMAGETQIPAGLTATVTADSAEGEILVFDSNGDAAPSDGSETGAIVAGVAYPSRTVLDGGQVKIWNGFGVADQETGAGESFDAGDRCEVAYVATSTTIAKKAADTGVGRPFGGLVFGVNELGLPLAWLGEIPALLARAKVAIENKLFGWYAHPVDGAANTTTAEKTIVREPVQGIVTAIYFESMGTLAADNTDYVTISVYKADGAGGTHALLGTYDSRAAEQGALAAGVPVAFELSAVAGALNLLSTDILTYAVAKAGSGKVVPVGTLRVLGKVC